MQNTAASILTPPVAPNLLDYETLSNSFNWQDEQKMLHGLPGNKGINMAYEAVEKQAAGKLKDTIALRWIQKDKTIKDFTYEDLNTFSSRFANVLTTPGVKKGERVFALAGRIPELYIAALGTLKTTAVFCPLYAVFGPEPVFQRLSKGDVKILVTTKELFEKKIKQLIDRLPSLQFILLTDEDLPVDHKVLSLPALMKAAKDEFVIPPANMEVRLCCILPYVLDINEEEEIDETLMEWIKEARDKKMP